MDCLKYWIWLSCLNGFSPSKALRFLNHFDDPEKIFNASIEDYKAVKGARAADCALLAGAKSHKSLEFANQVLADCCTIGCRVITLACEDYPERLKNIYDPPLVLYVRGTLPMIDDEPVIGIVGTRNCTPYGIGAAESISYNLASRGCIITTGLAKGIDTAAADGALRAGGRVIGVIGSGVDVVYPAENADLFNAVSAFGAIISEYPPGTKAESKHFPARNRIISGISLGVTVIEAPKRSGALITASRALEQGRDVFSLPGNVDARSCEGSNALLREGAIPIMSAEDIISEYAQLYPDMILMPGEKAGDLDSPLHYREQVLQAVSSHNKVPAKKKVVKKEIDNIKPVEYIDFEQIICTLDGHERIIAAAILDKTVHIDAIIHETGLTVSEVLTAITMLEIKGIATQDSGKFFSLSKQ